VAIQSNDFETPKPKPRTAAGEVQALIDEGTRAYEAENFKLAIAKFSQALRQSPKSTEALYQRGLAYFVQDQYREAIADCDSGLSVEPKSSRFLFLRGDARARSREFIEAVADLRLGLKFEAKSGFGWYMMGFCYVELREFDKAVDALDRAIKLDDEDAAAWYQRGRAYFYLDDNKATERDLDMAIELDTECTGAYEYRGRHYLFTGRYEEAASDLDMVVGILPEWYAVRAYRAEALVELDDRLEDALTDANLAVEHNPDWVYAYQVRAQVHVRRLDNAGALADLNKAIELDGGKNEELLLFRAQVQLFEGQYTDATADLETVVQLDPENATAYCLSAQLHFEEDRYPEALAASEASLALNAEDPDAVEIRALSQAKLKNRKAALADVERLFKLKGDEEADVYIVRGDCYYFLGDYPAAYKSYDRAMDLEPDNAEHANEYAYALASCPNPSHRDAKLALQLSDKALALAKNPQSQEAWWHRDTQAVALAADGQFERAVAVLDEVLKHLTHVAMRQESMDRSELFRQHKVFVEG
jgi:tetratricopeptide (TPR) repeat protein